MFIFKKKKDVKKKRSDAEISSSITDKLIKYELAKLRKKKKAGMISSNSFANNDNYGITVAEHPLCVPMDFDGTKNYFNECVTENMKEKTLLTFPTPDPTATCTKKS